MVEHIIDETDTRNGYAIIHYCAKSHREISGHFLTTLLNDEGHHSVEALAFVFFSTRHFPQLLAVYRTSILLKIRQITSKNPRTSRHFLYVPLPLRCCRRPVDRDWMRIH